MTTVMITGANRGIGMALTRCYLGEGADVIGCCRDPATAQALSALAAHSTARLRVMALDVADEASIANLRRELGDQPIDILIHNAGINGTPKEQSDKRIDADSYLLTMRVNALAPLLLSQALLGNLMRGSQKKLVAISSDLASTGTDYGATSLVRSERYSYRASKAALNNGMRGLARDWAVHGISILMLNPGFVKTDMTGARALASASAISAEHSARNLAARIAELTLEASGSFRDHAGNTLAW